MAENINKRPAKSILKTSTSIERPEQAKKPKEQRFDELNIIATLHPPDKDYGHMKIEEPKTPYSGYTETNLNPSTDQLDANILAAKLAANINKPNPPSPPNEDDEEPSSDEEDINESPEERKLRLEFESKRKKHYNEFQAIKLARQLMEEEDDDEDEEKESNQKKEDENDDGVSETK